MSVVLSVWNRKLRHSIISKNCEGRLGTGHLRLKIYLSLIWVTRVEMTETVALESDLVT